MPRRLGKSRFDKNFSEIDQKLKEKSEEKRRKKFDQSRSSKKWRPFDLNLFLFHFFFFRSMFKESCLSSPDFQTAPAGPWREIMVVISQAMLSPLSLSPWCFSLKSRLHPTVELNVLFVVLLLRRDAPRSRTMLDRNSFWIITFSLALIPTVGSVWTTWKVGI